MRQEKARWLLIVIWMFLVLFCSACAKRSPVKGSQAEEWTEQRQGAGDIYSEAGKYRIKIKPKEEVPLAEGPTLEREREIAPYESPRKERDVLEFAFPAGEEKTVVPPSPPEKEKGQPLSIRFQDADLGAVLDTIIVEIMDGSYVVEADPHQKLSLNIQGRFTQDDMLTTLRIMLESINLGLARYKGVYHVVPAKAATVMAENMKMLIRIPSYVRVENLIPILKDLKSDSGKLVTIQGSNVLFMLDYPANTDRAEALINVFDVSFFENRYVRVYSLKNASSADVASEFERLLNEYNVFTDKVPAHVRVVPLDRLNKIITIATSAEIIDYLDSWVEILDQERGHGDKAIFFTYRPKYAGAKDLAQFLSNLFPKLNKDAQHGLEAYADSEDNLLVIHARTAVYHEARALMADIDSQPSQVFIQVLLAEVKLTDDMEMGFEWFYQDKLGATAVEVGSTLGDQTGKALTISLVGEDFFGIMAQLIRDQKARVLATPHILVKDKKEASIEIVSEVPVIKSFLTTDIQAEGTSAQQPSIEYKDAGVILMVQPDIISPQEVEISVQQELSRSSEVTLVEGLNSFQFDKRKVDTKLLLKDQQTVLIGGLIEEETTTQITQTPCLGDMPLIEYLFKARGEMKTRTELVLFLTPVIVTDMDKLKTIGDEIVSSLSAAPKSDTPAIIEDDQ